MSADRFPIDPDRPTGSGEEETPEPYRRLWAYLTAWIDGPEPAELGLERFNLAVCRFEDRGPPDAPRPGPVQCLALEIRRGDLLAFREFRAGDALRMDAFDVARACRDLAGKFNEWPRPALPDPKKLAELAALARDFPTLVVIAGEMAQALDWCRAAGIDPKGRGVILATFAQQLRGIHRARVVLTGTYRERFDWWELAEWIEARQGIGAAQLFAIPY